MRLLFVIDSFTAGGAQRQFVNLVNEMVLRNHTVDIVVYHDLNHFANDLVDSNVTVYFAKKKWRFSLAPLWKIRKLSLAHSYDTIYAWLVVPCFYAIISQFFLKNKTPVIISARSGADSVKGSTMLRSIFKLYRFATHAITNSYHMKDYFTKEKKWNDTDVTAIWNGLDLDKFCFTNIEPQHGKYQFLAIGHLKPLKQWLYLIEAMAILKKEHSLNITVNWVGRTDDLSDVEIEYRSLMKQKIKEYQLEDQWNELGRRKDVPDLFSQCTGIIHPSTLEGLPNVVCEALACGRPAIATDMLDHPRLIQHEKTGYLVEPHSVKSLAEAILKLCNLSKKELCKISENARAFAEENLTIKALGDQHEKLFEKISNKQ